ncbi:hypothetical protein [Mycobacterium sp. E740]|uniref:hypothetical protein n=1 Tax=Mycobacterium sp. E740 TaxID=1834149 RepID=UPI0008019DAC|nr:hypothetical protein [Mycobacterium sp. E740]OBI81177.1 hypothetical protein A5663_16455 [Mycobacterium sp. E740]
MRSNEVADVLAAVESAYKQLAALRFDGLTRTELYALLERLDRLDHQRAALDQRLMGRLLAAGGLSSRDVARRLRISPAEAQRRLRGA